MIIILIVLKPMRRKNNVPNRLLFCDYNLQLYYSIFQPNKLACLNLVTKHFLVVMLKIWKILTNFDG